VLIKNENIQRNPSKVSPKRSANVLLKVQMAAFIFIINICWKAAWDKLFRL